jgi:hypothetical protein
MKRGPKPQLPSEKLARGTFQPVRDGNRVEAIEADAMPMRPTWLTPEGEEVWLDDIGRVQPGKLVSERDSTAFANYCNMQGMIIRCWRGNEAPPITAVAEVRKQQEMFGIAGAKSRVTVKSGSGGGSGNAFARNGSR